MFSGEHMGLESVVNANFVPIVVLILAFPINLILHHRYVQDEGNSYKFAHGFLSAVFPTRFVKNKTPSVIVIDKKFLG